MSLIGARGKICVGVCDPRLGFLCLWVGEMRGEEFVLSVIFEIFEFGCGRTWE